ncbi:outer membrane beta-barrel protein [Acidithiobacillus sulfuriphilus]|uniref:Outer membrane beta-barrel protein n=1 Tax=Acidithiobacillus sulfuriphilus TaxID=1867749 RepID=A0ACD5HTD0_9PROT|nr:outer membrane beta-barrel protein [Acidithiobacillus sulfuriphilus]
MKIDVKYRTILAEVLFSGTLLIAGNAYADPLTMPSSLSFSAGPLGKIKAQGVLSGFGFWQDNAPSAANVGPLGGKSVGMDISNAFLILKKNSGLVQFYLQAGAYNFPGIGLPFASTSSTLNSYGALPIAYLKIAPTSNFSIEIGKLPTLIGPTGSFSYQRNEIEGGLLWDVENVVNRGVQVNYENGPVSLSVSWNDGYYSNRYNWVDGLLTYAINGSNSISFYGGGNLGHTGSINGSYSTNSSVNASLTADNSEIYGLYYEYSSGPWIVKPYIQYMYTPANLQYGVTRGSDNYGASIHVDYSISKDYSIAGRVEYYAADGVIGDGGVSGSILGYGNGAHAWAVSITPTYQDGGFFTRAELSYIRASCYKSGGVFGVNGTNPSQVRGLVETGFMF